MKGKNQKRKTVWKGPKQRLEPRFVRTALKTHCERNKIFILLRSFLGSHRAFPVPCPCLFQAIPTLRAVPFLKSAPIIAYFTEHFKQSNEN